MSTPSEGALAALVGTLTRCVRLRRHGGLPARRGQRDRGLPPNGLQGSGNALQRPSADDSRLDLPGSAPLGQDVGPVPIRIAALRAAPRSRERRHPVLKPGTRNPHMPATFASDRGGGCDGRHVAHCTVGHFTLSSKFGGELVLSGTSGIRHIDRRTVTGVLCAIQGGANNDGDGAVSGVDAGSC